MELCFSMAIYENKIAALVLKCILFNMTNFRIEHKIYGIHKEEIYLNFNNYGLITLMNYTKGIILKVKPNLLNNTTSIKSMVPLYESSR